MQISNVNEFLGGDMDLLDGYDDLPQEYKDKIDFALKNGHVPDEDWKGVRVSMCFVSISANSD